MNYYNTELFNKFVNDFIRRNVKVVITDPNEFVNWYLSSPYKRDFVWDRTSGVFFCNLVMATHEVFMMKLLENYTSPITRTVDETTYSDYTADNFIVLGYGIFRSKVGTKIYMSDFSIIPASLRPLIPHMEIL